MRQMPKIVRKIMEKLHTLSGNNVVAVGNCPDDNEVALVIVLMNRRNFSWLIVLELVLSVKRGLELYILQFR
jgi:hypothetical protein